MSPSGEGWSGRWLFTAPTYVIDAFGAIECTATRSSDSSPYQPCASRWFSGKWNVPGTTSWVKLDELTVGNPCSAENRLRSYGSVGEAKASTIPTRTPA